MDKPKLTPEQLVKKMETEKGITFTAMSEEDAISFLTEKNNYYRLSSYRKNYDKRLSGSNVGQYIRLDFAYLVDLSIIDMHLRNVIFQMCLDIEHDLKVKILNDITEDSDEDGYNIVREFIENNPSLKEEIFKKRFSSYVGDLINKFFTFESHINASGKEIIDSVEIRCPIWAFVEIISFGTFIKLYLFYYDLQCPIQSSLLNPIKNIRNACAHNNCLINNLRKSTTRPSKAVTDVVAKIPTISSGERKRYLSVKPIFEFCCLLIVYNDIVSENVKKHRYEELFALINERLRKHSDYYKDQQLLTYTYYFIKNFTDFFIN